MGKQYYIGGKRYSPEESIELCSHALLGAPATLYRSPKGTLFLVEKSECTETTVKILTDKEAFGFMDAHPAGIITENYDAVFGEPDPG